jgi:phytanoyl-CoA hydroxylase
MKITREQHEHYQQKGWVVIEGVFPHAAVDALARRALEIITPEVTADAELFKVDRSADGKELAPRKLDHPFERDLLFGRAIFESPMPDLIEQLTGAAPLFHSDQLFFKPPLHGSPKAYHQDNAYFLMHPDDHVITAWIALDDVDAENGCLRYIDGSHLGPILPSVVVPGVPQDLTPDPSLYDIKKESLAVVKKGGVVFHHSKALHASGRNTSARWRRGYATHWIAAGVWGENDVIDRAYVTRRPDLFEAIGVKIPAAV